jgi:hypothetical protein
MVIKSINVKVDSDSITKYKLTYPRMHLRNSNSTFSLEKFFESFKSILSIQRYIMEVMNKDNPEK